jgi:biopolymer transport protein ExbD
MRLRKGKMEKVPIDMTPMIDIVFQLQAFFVMTFSFVTPEGDFNIKMPLAAPSEGTPDEELLPPIKILLKGGDSGALSQIKMGDRDIQDFQVLRGEIMSMVGNTGPSSEGGGYEVEFACDYDLHYEHVIAAITAVTGYRNRENQVVKLIEKIKFAPPQKK